MKPALLSHPVFIAALGTLLLNDWVLKPIFHNALTGKLSDFAGLFAFAFFWSALFPKQQKGLHLLSAALFCWWKSPYAQGFIDALNQVQIPLQRVVDYSDYWALLSIPASYFTLQKVQWTPQPVLLNGAIMLISLFSFIATTLPPPQRVDVEVNKTYHFDFSKAELVARMNGLQLGELGRMSKAFVLIEFIPDNNIYYTNSWGRRDTLAVMFDAKEAKSLDTLYYRSSLAHLQIMGNDSTSSIRLLRYRRYLKWHTNKDQQEKTIAYFEKHILKKIKKHPPSMLY